MQNLIHDYQEKMISDGASATEATRAHQSIRPESPQSPSSPSAASAAHSAQPLIPRPQSPTQTGSLPLSRPDICLIIDNLPSTTSQHRMENILRSRVQKKSFEKVVILSQQESVQFGPNPTLSMKIIFNTREDLVLTAKEFVSKHSVRIESNVLQMRILKDKAQFNPETSIFVRNLNPSCTEVQLIQEINQIFKYNLTYRNELLKGDKREHEKAQGQSKNKIPFKKVDLNQYFVLGCLIIKNRQTLQSKRIAFIDFECADAAKIIIKAWNQRNMESYQNRLDVKMFNHEHIKLTLEKRQERSKTRERQFTNLYVSGLPTQVDEKFLYDIFFEFGEVQSVKLKRSNLYAIDVMGATNSAYINFESHDQAKDAIDKLNGKPIVPGGTEKVRIEFYRKDNKFMGIHKGLNRQELINNTHFRVLFISGLYLHITQEQVQDICRKFGQVDIVTLKTRIEFEKAISRGIAIVQFSTKEGASNALKKLNFEDQLGDPSRIQIDYYQSKESRQKQILQEQEKVFKDSALNLDSQPFKKLLKDVKGEPIIDAIQMIKQNIMGFNQEVEVQAEQEAIQNMNYEIANGKARSQYYPPAPPVDASHGPNYVIRKIVPPLKMNKLNQYNRQNRQSNFYTPGSRTQYSQMKTSSTQNTQQRSRSEKRVKQHQTYHIVDPNQPPVPTFQQKRNRSPQVYTPYAPKLTIKAKKAKKRSQVVRDSPVIDKAPLKKVEIIDTVEQKSKPKTQRMVKFDDNVSKISLKIDLESVYSQKTKDMDEEHRAQRTIKKYMNRRQEIEDIDMVDPSKSWRNRSKSRQDSGRGEANGSRSNSKREAYGSRSNSKRGNRNDAEGYESFVNKSSNIYPGNEDKGNTSATRKASNSPKHSYSPRYLEYLFKNPDNDPKEKELMKERIRSLSPRDEHSPRQEEEGFNISISDQKSKPQNFIMQGSRKGQLNPFGAKPFRPTKFKEESRSAKKPDTKSQVRKALPISMSQTNFNGNDMIQVNTDVDRINQGNLGYKSNFNPSSPNVDIAYEGFSEGFQPNRYDSPQPCISPSSLINIIQEDDPQSAPIGAPDFRSYQGQSIESGNGNGGKEEEKKEPFGLFDWNWDDEDDSDAKSSQHKAFDRAQKQESSKEEEDRQ